MTVTRARPLTGQWSESSHTEASIRGTCDSNGAGVIATIVSGSYLYKYRVAKSIMSNVIRSSIYLVKYSLKILSFQ